MDVLNQEFDVEDVIIISNLLVILKQFEGIIGAIFAGVVTLLGVIFSIKHSEKETKKDRDYNRTRDLENQIKSVMPYIQMELESGGTGLEDCFELYNLFDIQTESERIVLNCFFKNIGRDSAVNIDCSLPHLVSVKYRNLKNIFINNRSLAKDQESIKVKISLEVFNNNLNKYVFSVNFEDLIGNKYLQKIYIEINGDNLYFDQIKQYSENPMLLNIIKKAL